MWSLPDIQRMNAVAAATAKSKKKDPCRDHTCEYCKDPARHAEEWWDIFGPHPKGHVFTCDKHYEEWGGAHEGYFYCGSCNLFLVSNYTWETYYQVRDGEMVCLKCAFREYIADKKNWVTVAPAAIGLEDFKHVPHVIAVDSHYWEEDLVFVGNAEFDATDGHQISGDAVVDIVRQAIEEHGKCILLLDAAYQFAVSIGVYAKKAKAKNVKKVKKGRRV